MRSFVDRHFSETAPDHMWHAVMPCETFIEKRVIRFQQGSARSGRHAKFLRTATRFAAKRVAQVVIEIGKKTQIRRERLQIAKMQPLPCEILHQAFRTLIRSMRRTCFSNTSSRLKSP
jgi:hypothetical protein